MKWHGKQFYSALQNHNSKNLTAAGTLLAADVKQLLSTSGRSVTETTTKTGKKRRKLGKRGSAPSLPGEPPRKQTGELRRGVYKKLRSRRTVMRVGNRAPHSGLLEYGTRTMEPRPSIRTALTNNANAIGLILARPMK